MSPCFAGCRRCGVFSMLAAVGGRLGVRVAMWARLPCSVHHADVPLLAHVPVPSLQGRWQLQEAEVGRRDHSRAARRRQRRRRRRGERRWRLRSWWQLASTSNEDDVGGWTACCIGACYASCALQASERLPLGGPFGATGHELDVIQIHGGSDVVVWPSRRRCGRLRAGRQQARLGPLRAARPRAAPTSGANGGAEGLPALAHGPAETHDLYPPLCESRGLAFRVHIPPTARRCGRQ
mmetsp:Transcript_86605/g.250099  ORF Transcript_86605/g.250099 Transcript_86605/m.250099 type:complete len:237 (-) Transcript_86605:339-1049(-)